MQMLAINSRVVLRPTVRLKIKRRLREAVKLIVTRGAEVEESRKGLKVVFRTKNVGADKWIAPGVLLLLFHAAPNGLSFFRCYYSRWTLHADWTYVASPTSEMFRMSFAELLNTTRRALVFLRRCIPEAEKVLKCNARENGIATSLVRCQKNRFYHPLVLLADWNSLLG